MPDNKLVRWLRENLFLVATIIGVVIGIGLGVGLRRHNNLTALDAAYLKFPGEMLLRGLKMAVLPLIIFSIISSIAGLDRKTTGKLGGIAVAYYAVTTFIAVVIGIIMCATIKPGRYGQEPLTAATASVGELSPVDTILDIIRNIVPENIVYAQSAQIKTFRKVAERAYDCNNAIPLPDFGDFTGCSGPVEAKFELKSINTGYNDTRCEWTEEQYTASGMQYDCIWSGLGKEYAQPRTNILGVLFFCICLAIAITRIKDDKIRNNIIGWFSGINECIMMIVYVIIWYAPIGIIFLIASEIVKMDNANEVFARLGIYVGTVLGGLAIHFFIVLPIVFLIGTGEFANMETLKAFPLRYINFIRGIAQAMLTALSTASSSATLPITIACLENNNGIDPRVARFVLPIGATINMDGTALYEAVAAIFMAQYEGLDLNFGDYIVISITATVASVGAAGIPQAGLVTLIIVMTAIGIPPDRVSLILAVDWFLDRFRTSLNVTGDSIGCAVVQARVNLADLKEIELEDLPAVETVDDKPRDNQISPETKTV